MNETKKEKKGRNQDVARLGHTNRKQETRRKNKKKRNAHNGKRETKQTNGANENTQGKKITNLKQETKKLIAQGFGALAGFCKVIRYKTRPCARLN